MSVAAHACLTPRAADAAVCAQRAERERQIIDLFRHIAAFRLSYDAKLLDEAAAFAAGIVGPTLADDLMAAAIRLDNEMRCQTAVDYAPLPVGSPERHECEDAFLGMLLALSNQADRAALGLAGRLGVVETRALFASARALAAILGWPDRAHPREVPARPRRRHWPETHLAYGQA